MLVVELGAAPSDQLADVFRLTFEPLKVLSGTMTVIARGAAALVPFVLVAVRVTLEVPVALGVPLMRPVAVSSVRPVGSVPEARAKDVRAPWSAVIW